MNINYENGKYVLYLDLYPPKTAVFNTLLEAKMSDQQIRYARRLQDITTQLAQIADDCPDLFKLFWDRGYGAGGANVITDEQLSAIGLTAADVSAMITLIEQFDNFASGRAVFATDYKSTMNRMRADV